MKKIALALITVFVSLPLFAQNYNEIVKQGDDALNRGDYPAAISRYLAAKELDPNKLKDVMDKLDKVYGKIEADRNELKQTKTELAQVRQALTKAEETVKNLRTANAVTPVIPLLSETAVTQNPCDELSDRLEQYAKFSKLLAKCNPLQICKKLNYPTDGGANDRIERIADEFSKAGMKQRQVIINAFNSVIK